jgi:hypothetical protein
MPKKASPCLIQLPEPNEDCGKIKAHQLSAHKAVEQMLQIIIEAVAYVVDDKSFSVVYYVPRIPRPVGYWLHEFLISGKAETRTDLQSDHSVHLLKRLHSSS